MRATSTTTRGRTASWLLLAVVAVPCLAGTGCLGYERQSIILAFPPEEPEATADNGRIAHRPGADMDRPSASSTRLASGPQELHALIVFEGIGTDKGQHDADGAELAQFIQQDGFMPFQNLWVQLSPESMLNGPAIAGLQPLARKHITAQRGTLYLNDAGELSVYQTVTIRKVPEFVTRLNALLSAAAVKVCDRPEPDNGVPLFPYDKFSLPLLQRAERDRFEWLRIDRGQVAYSMPGSPQVLSGVRNSFLSQTSPKNRLRLGKGADEPPLPAPGAPDAPCVQNVFQSPWSLVQHPDRLTVTLGTGRDEPLHYGHEMRFKPREDDAQGLLKRACELGVKYRKDATTKTLIRDFLRSHGSGL